jgi:hypothetical protein
MKSLWAGIGLATLLLVCLPCAVAFPGCALSSALGNGVRPSYNRPVVPSASHGDVVQTINCTTGSARTGTTYGSIPSPQAEGPPVVNSSAAYSQILNVPIVYPMQGAAQILVTITANSSTGLDPVITDPSGQEHPFVTAELGNGQLEWTFGATTSYPQGNFTLIIHAPAGVLPQDVSLEAEFSGFSASGGLFGPYPALNVTAPPSP